MQSTRYSHHGEHTFIEGTFIEGILSSEVGNLETIQYGNNELLMTLYEFRIAYMLGWWRRNQGRKAIIIPQRVFMNEPMVLVTPRAENIPDFRTVPGVTEPSHIPCIDVNEHGLYLMFMRLPEKSHTHTLGVVSVDWEGCSAELMLHTDDIPASCRVMIVSP
jgi:hypothetical protein